jgi:serine/threonine-protein kinase
VKIQQFVLPPEQKFMQWYWLLSQFEREVRRLSCVNSNNITRWLDVFVENGSIFVVTEYDASQTLRELVKQSGPLPEARVREIALEMCEILLHLHQLDPPYVHKAFTPDALVLAKEGFVKLNRFALGHQLVPSQTFASYFDRRYVSPEQLRDRASFQSDIYSFGCTLFYLLTGEDPKPLQQSNPKALRPELSDRFNEIVLKASEPAAGSRYDSAAAIKDAILELANSETRLALL